MVVWYNLPLSYFALLTYLQYYISLYMSCI